MPDQAVTSLVGLYGKLPAHGDFVRRGLPAAVVGALDNWLQGEFGRTEHPASAIAAMPPVHFGSMALLDGHRAVGVMIASTDSVGRDFPIIALALSASDAEPGEGEDWSALAEAALLAARDQRLTADEAYASLPTGIPTPGSDDLPRGDDFDRLTGQQVVA